MKKNNFLSLFVIGIVLLLVIFVGITITSYGGKTKKEITESQGLERLNKILNNVYVSNRELSKSIVSLNSNPQDELPDINKYPLSVRGNGDINIEIFATSEKSGKGNDGWINEMAEDFNKQYNQLNGKTVSVSIRPMASGLGTDYITSGKYLPDAFTPSNNLWGKMIESSGTIINVSTDRLLGNVAGILLSEEKYKELNSKYESVDIKAITQATANNEIAMGYTNPFASATGLNFLMTTLHAYDATNPLSYDAIAGFETFQKNIPFVSYTTLQMTDAAASGVLDGFIMEYQTYINDVALRKYKFIPFGIRHDNPVYIIGNLSTEKQTILDMFVEYCKQPKSQELATKYGFNKLDDYKGDSQNLTGDTLYSAQSIYKENKNIGRPVTAVFIADTSGSMNGEAINGLKKSLIIGSQYINSDNYIGLVSYNDDVYVDLPIAKFDLNHRAYFTGAVENLSASGGTASYDAVCVALNMLLESKKANPDTKLLMFLLSDGETNTGHTLKNIKPILESLKIPVYTIGYNANLNELEELSKINEGANINADSDDVIYKLKSLFNSEM